jgi:hypothetical protein
VFRLIYVRVAAPLNSTLSPVTTVPQKAAMFLSFWVSVVMTDHAEDKHVSAMLKLTLGGDAEYQAKFEAVKGDSQIQ